MKILAFLVLIACFNYAGANAQRLTADELIMQTNCTDFPCYSDLISRKGFSYDSTIKDGYKTFYVFPSDGRIDESGVSSISVALLILPYDGSYVQAGFRTPEKSVYHTLISAFKGKGFKPVNITDKGRRVTTEYKSAKYKNYNLTVMVERFIKGKLSWTTYDFQIMKHR